MNRGLKVNTRGDRAEFVDNDGDMFFIEIYSTGETIITCSSGLDAVPVSLSNQAAHELRDMLCRRFPIAQQ